MDKCIEELSPSELGTLEYWEKTYTSEIENFQDHGDVGEIWFGSQSSAKVVRFIDTELRLSKEFDKIIDLGCGNGMMLISLAKVGFQDLTGVDYSQKAIDLARKVMCQEGFPEVKLQVYDILEPTSNSSQGQDFQFKLAHDKGTYDAISLHPHDSANKREEYARNVYKILFDGGFFVITSCNWTKEELIKHFQEYFELVHELPAKSFSFGGQTGNKITQLVFVKK